MILVNDQERLANWFAARVGLVVPLNMSYLGCVINEKIVAVNAYEKFNGASMYIHMVVEGMATKEFLQAAFDYPFNYCKAQMLIGPVASGNTKALRLTKHLGFKIEHEIKGAHPDGALVYMTMTREECRFLGKNWGIRGRV